MLNIIKSIRYSLRRDYLAWAYAIAVLALYILRGGNMFQFIQELLGAFAGLSLAIGVFVLLIKEIIKYFL